MQKKADEIIIDKYYYNNDEVAYCFDGYPIIVTNGKTVSIVPYKQTGLTKAAFNRVFQAAQEAMRGTK